MADAIQGKDDRHEFVTSQDGFGFARNWNGCCRRGVQSLAVHGEQQHESLLAFDEQSGREHAPSVAVRHGADDARSEHDGADGEGDG
jgi:hypothetical protein